MVDDAASWVQNWSGAQLHMNLSLANKGADTGIFFQQVLALSDPSRYDMLLKLHTKSDARWRCTMLMSLCGSSEQVSKILSRFDSQPDLGIIGPWSLTWTWDTPVEETYEKKGGNAFTILDGQKQMEDYMKRVWADIFQNRSFPARDQYLMAAGSMYWARSAPLLENVQFRDAASRWIESWTTKPYKTACSDDVCLQLYALERIMLTMIQARYGFVGAEAPDKYGLDKSKRAYRQTFREHGWSNDKNRYVCQRLSANR
ncbi:unnamed protein product [Prorocentrum cordatum]|uniref:Uncharacterized protein n=1 Tax=Prorocentrum cordatum TaxID=2364126 RepID=A0ABN9T5Z5_9DINO|nr:unnamed protein product [Polarella glacialis]